MSNRKKAYKKPIDFATGFTQAVAANQKVWEHDRSLTVGASEAFNCILQNVYKKRYPELASGADEADPEWGHTERGNLIENEFVVPSLRAMFGEENCFYMGKDQRTFVDGRLSATPDGVVVDLDEDALLNYGVVNMQSSELATEVKSFGGEHAAPKKKKVIDPNNAGKNIVRYEAKPKHQGQNIIQMGILRRKTNYKPNFGVVLYVNPVNLKDIRPAVVKYDETVYARAMARADDVFDMTKKLEDYPAEGRLGGNDCNYCDFYDHCHAMQMAKFPDGQIVKLADIDPTQAKELEELARTVAGIRAKEKELETSKKLEESKLKDLMFDVGTTRVGGEGWSVSISKNNGRKSLDKDKLVEDFDIDLEDYQKEGSPYFVMRVKAED